MIVTMPENRANEIVEDRKTPQERGERLIIAAKAQIDQEIQQAKKVCVKKWLSLIKWPGRDRFWVQN